MCILNVDAGVPAEMYSYGAAYWMVPVGATVAAFVSVTIFIPVFFPLKITSINQVMINQLIILKTAFIQYLVSSKIPSINQVI